MIIMLTIQKKGEGFKMKKGFGFLVSMVAAILIVFLFSNYGILLPVGDTGPLFTKVHSYGGKTWTLEKLKGKPIVLNFWATWCPACIDELPTFSQLSRKYTNQVHFVGLVVDSPMTEVAHMVKKFAIAYPLAAVGFEVLEAWKANSLPTTYVLDAEGKIVWSRLGMVSQRSLEEILVELIGIEPTTS
jgi:cytochrome c biogenesis protein CcmG, thiol:disulfide interchange protein DsbE